MSSGLLLITAYLLHIFDLPVMLFFIAFYMEDGYAVFVFDLGSGAAKLKSDEMLTLNKWHLVEMSRVERVGRLQVDQQIVVSGVSPGPALESNIGELTYVGGLPDTIAPPASVAVFGKI